VKMARIEIADIHFKQQDLQDAELAYLAILSEYGSDDREICEVAAKGLINIYKAQVLPEKAVQVGEKYACAGLTKGQEEEIFYTPAKNAYIDSTRQLAETISLFKKYLERYPNGVYAVEANNYTADCYFRMTSFEEAIVLYREMLEGPSNRFTEEAALRVSKYLFNHEKQEEAIPYYLILEQVSADPSVIYNSRLNLMRSYFLTEQWGEASQYAKIMLGESQINTTLRLEAEYANAFSNYRSKNFNEALPSLIWLTKNTTTATGSEAQFLIAEMLFEQKEFEKTDMAVQTLIKMKPSYNYWVARGLMLQAKILIEKQDLFQAEETLNSILEHYPIPNDGVLDEANESLTSLLLLKNVEKEIEVDTIPVIELNEVEDEE